MNCRLETGARHSYKQRAVGRASRQCTHTVIKTENICYVANANFIAWQFTSTSGFSTERLPSSQRTVDLIDTSSEDNVYSVLLY